MFDQFAGADSDESNSASGSDGYNPESFDDSVCGTTTLLVYQG
jgi:hypothetical protein